MPIASSLVVALYERRGTANSAVTDSRYKNSLLNAKFFKQIKRLPSSTKTNEYQKYVSHTPPSQGSASNSLCGFIDCNWSFACGGIPRADLDGGDAYGVA